ncbi:DUF4340 domain-containing protein, partial [Thermodesulfobacteriota bacterium]
TFVKLADDHRVYHARKNLRNDFDKTVDEFRDKAVLPFERDKIKNIEIIKGTQTTQLTLKQTSPEKSADEGNESKSSENKTAWVNADNKNVDKAKIDSLFSSLSDLRCQEYIYDKQKNDMADPMYTVKLKGDKEQSLQIFKKADEEAHNYPAISSENDSAFYLIGWQAERIIKDSDAIINTDNTAT